MLPYQRYRLQAEYREKVDELSASLEQAVLAHLTRELHNAKDRASSLVTPFATLVGSADAHQAEQRRALEASREALDAIEKELAKVRRGEA